jgi:hypothetical protein
MSGNASSKHSEPARQKSSGKGPHRTLIRLTVALVLATSALVIIGVLTYLRKTEQSRELEELKDFCNLPPYFTLLSKDLEVSCQVKTEADFKVLEFTLKMPTKAAVKEADRIIKDKGVVEERYARRKNDLYILSAKCRGIIKAELGRPGDPLIPLVAPLDGAKKSAKLYCCSVDTITLSLLHDLIEVYRVKYGEEEGKIYIRVFFEGVDEPRQAVLNVEPKELDEILKTGHKS